MSNLVGRKAVVIGAGIGGLSAAGALARYFEQVEVLERDELSEEVRSRPGTPQDRHPNGLLAGGLKALDEIFPEFQKDLAQAGAVPVRIGRDILYERGDVGGLPMRDFGLSGLFASRPLTEMVLRRRVMSIANIALRSECLVTGIVPSAVAMGTARGVQFRVKSGPIQMLEADLVVDASGRGALTLAFLDVIGWEPPKVTAIGADISYATAVVEIPAELTPEWKVMLTLPHPPAVALNGVLLPMEGDRWITMVSDYGTIARPRTWNSFLDATRRLTTPTLFNALRYAKPLEEIRHHSFPVSSWRHFEQLSRLPRGVLPIADAICRFNPIYCQGLSAAAQQARLLQIVVETAASRPDPLLTAQTNFMAEVEAVIEAPWHMSTSADLAFPTTLGERPGDFEQGRLFEAALHRAAVADPVVHHAMFEVWQLLQPPAVLKERRIKQRIEPR